MSNSNLHKAKTEKNDEFYTQLSDIENEMKHYKKHFKGKHVFLNCDDPEKSNFWKFFSLNFEHLGLKALTSTHLDESSYKLEICADINGDGKIDHKDVVKTPLKGNGDFRSDEAIEILKECDIVVTNPPFSLFREYIAQLTEYNKDFIIIGNMNAVTYKDTFTLIKDNKVWLGNTKPKTYNMPDGSTTTHGNHCWFTNLDFPKRHEDIILCKEYTPKEYATYDNYNGIEVGDVKNIPIDYEGVMGVPVSYIEKHNPNQFEIVGSFDVKDTFEVTHGYKDLDRCIYGKEAKRCNINNYPLYRAVKDMGKKTCYKKDGIVYYAPYTRLLIIRKGNK